MTMLCPPSSSPMFSRRVARRKTFLATVLGDPVTVWRTLRRAATTPDNCDGHTDSTGRKAHRIRVTREELAKLQEVVTRASLSLSLNTHTIRSLFFSSSEWQGQCSRGETCNLRLCTFQSSRAVKDASIEREKGGRIIASRAEWMTTRTGYPPLRKTARVVTFRSGILRWKKRPTASCRKARTSYRACIDLLRISEFFDKYGTCT